MAQVDFIYPAGLAERYDPDMVMAAKLFTELLFMPEMLPLVTANNFTEVHAGEGVTLHNLAELQAYRRALGEPELYSVKMIAVPPSQRAEVPDGSGRFYDIDHFFELFFGLRAEDLPPEVAANLPPGTRIPTVVRMREPYAFHRLARWEARKLDRPDGAYLVTGRTYWPFGETGPLEPHGQMAFVGRQVEYYLQTGGRTMIEDGLIVPLEALYEAQFPGLLAF